MVAIARAIVHDPRKRAARRADNGPRRDGDPRDERDVRGLKEEGRCVLFTSHVMQEVAALATGCGRRRRPGGRRGHADELRAHTGKAALEDAFVEIIARGGLER
jgi:sodium transport system ATP-binding protein